MEPLTFDMLTDPNFDLRAYIDRRFVERFVASPEYQAFLAEELDRILHGDPSAPAPRGILTSRPISTTSQPAPRRTMSRRDKRRRAKRK